MEDPQKYKPGISIFEIIEHLMNYEGLAQICKVIAYIQNKNSKANEFAKVYNNRGRFCIL